MFHEFDLHWKLGKLFIFVTEKTKKKHLLDAHWSSN